MLEKTFINKQLRIELKSFIDDKFNVWFKGKEVSTILGYKDTGDAVRRHVSAENKISQFINPKSCPGETPGQVKKSCPRETRAQVQKAGVDVLPPQVQQGRWYTFINEPGFYELVFRSKLETAKIFVIGCFPKSFHLFVNMVTTNVLIL